MSSLKLISVLMHLGSEQKLVLKIFILFAYSPYILDNLGSEKMFNI
jgi:hypothetical protein